MLHLGEPAEGTEAGLDLAGQGRDLSAGEEGLGLPEEAVVGGEPGGKLGLEPVKLAADLLVVVDRRAEFAARFLSVMPEGLERGPRLVAFPPDFDLRGVDQFLGLARGVERGLELSELADQVLEVLLVGVGLFERAEVGRAGLAVALGRAPGAGLDGAELLGGLMRLGGQLLGARLGLGLSHQLGEPFQGWSHGAILDGTRRR